MFSVVVSDGTANLIVSTESCFQIMEMVYPIVEFVFVFLTACFCAFSMKYMVWSKWVFSC